MLISAFVRIENQENVCVSVCAVLIEAHLHAYSS